MKVKRQNTTKPGLLMSGASLAVLSVLGVGFLPTSGFAQDAAASAEPEEIIVVTGVRASLKNAQKIKRDAETIVDSITAADIGAFPDKSVAEALQRVAGVTVNRFAATSDTAHFSAEPSGVIVRGLTLVRSEFNGRDTFSANSSRGLSWGDVSPELMGGVDTYKNQMAELIEGGIAGSINLRTRVPFDARGRVIALGANLNHGDLSGKTTPEISGTISDRWVTDIGEFGLLGSLAWSTIQTASEGIQLNRMGLFDGSPTATPIYGGGLKYIPGSISYRDNVYDRDRTGIALAGQWQDLDKKWLVTAQYNRSEYKNSWHEYVASTFPADLFYSRGVYYNINGNERGAEAPRPAAGTPAFTFDDRGFFQTGTMTSDIGWWGQPNTSGSGPYSRNYLENADGNALVNACYTWGGDCPTGDVNRARRSPDFNTQTRYNENTNITEDFGINLKWTPTDRLSLMFDAQKINATVENYDIEVGLNSFATPKIDLTGERPKVTIVDPINVNLSAGGLANPGNYYIRHIMDHLEDSEGEEIAVRADAEYKFETDWLNSIKVGVRYADRDQTVRWSGYNWQNVANAWTENAAYSSLTNGPSGNFTGFPTNLTSVRDIGPGLFGGGFLSSGPLTFINMDMIENRTGFANTLSATALGLSGGAGWDPICSNKGDRAAEIPGTCYRLSEISDISEESKAAYIMLRFGGPDATIGGIGVSGNLGVRYVETVNTSTGGLVYPNAFTTQDLLCQPRVNADPMAPPPNPPNTLGCYYSPDELAFNNGGEAPSIVSVKHENVLPSFNLKLDLNDDWVLRFAASRAMSRPDIGNLKNYLGVSRSVPSLNSPDDPRWIKNSSGTITGVNPSYTGSAYNPYLKPTTADQLDVSLEWYFDEVGSLSLAAFKKKFQDYLQYGRYNRVVTNNGVTRTVEVRGPINGDGAEIQGFEVSYQQYYDFLPGLLSGLGLQANFTYVDNQGIENTNVTPTGDGTGSNLNAGVPDYVQVDALEGLSETSYNLVGLYEKGKVAARLAYNWRSEYVITVVDCCVYRPVWQEAAGFLDASFKYTVNNNVEFSLQGSNLLDTETVLKQQVTDADDGGLLLPNAWFRNDRRVTFGVRLKY